VLPRGSESPTRRKTSLPVAQPRLAFSAPAGAGKTRSALEVATYISQQETCKTILIDTEAGSGDNYADLYDYAVMPFEQPFSHQR
jgi:hypothetical protein